MASKTVTPYIPHTEGDIRRMCEAANVGSIDELVKSVLPEKLRLKSGLKLPKGLSEQELKAHVEGVSSKNKGANAIKSFLGAGAYNHYSPAAVNHILLRSEFFTSYTPYQPEASQGTLQAIFEYQTLICQLTGMDISNASLYDGASATAEAALMARRVTGRNKVVIAGSVHPEYRETTRTYLYGSDETPLEAPFDTKTGLLDIKAAEAALDDAACLIIQSPNFFGTIENVKELAELAHSKGALLVVVISEALSMAFLTPAGELGADIVVGDGQSFGNALSYGGPYLGFMGLSGKFTRQMPGRVVGETVDKTGKRSFCLTFATREQHIRREKATSNICTNQGLAALACSVYLALLGKTGLMELASLNIDKAEFLKKKLSAIKGVEIAFSSDTFNEFVIRTKKNPEVILAALKKKNIVGGLALKRFYPEMKSHILVTATEMNTAADIEEFARELKRVS
ncbi:MAG: aminomethyl-transferring glycine dehydrogenase subunit GcvPA [Deltaproteobacteria bacterium]|nr:aminomethyl-transferring glycine dehydrogenase subunit GcvPA [Deltaproteobacteria bacterium]